MYSVEGDRGADNFHDVFEGTRQYFMGVPKPAHAEGAPSSQPVWSAPPPEEGSPAQSGAPTPSSRPPSAAAAPPSTPNAIATSVPPRPPSEPIEPEAHIIHKPTVMREAAEKRRELPESEDDEEPVDALSPPSHIIRKPPPRVQSSPAPAPAAPCPSPARPPSGVPPPTPPAPESLPESMAQYRPIGHRCSMPTARPPDHFAPSRPPDPYSPSRPPESSYHRYHYDQALHDTGRNSQGPPAASPQPSSINRNSPQLSYARMTNSISPHTSSRLRDTTSHSPPVQRYAMPTQPPPPPNNRVPPIHHPQTVPVQRMAPVDSKQSHVYPHVRREALPYDRITGHYDRHIAMQARKYEHHHQSHSGYRPTTSVAPVPDSRLDAHLHHKHTAVEVIPAPFTVKTQDRTSASRHLQYNDAARMPSRVEYSNISKTVDSRSGYHYQTPSTSTVRYAPTAPVPVVQNTAVQSSTTYRAAAPKPNYEYLSPNQVQSSPARSSVKPNVPSQQSRMTVSVTTILNQMRQSPLDLSVKTVKNSADSSTTQDDGIDSVTSDTKTMAIIQSRAASSNRQVPQVQSGYVTSHKVDFAPNFTAQYRERNQNCNTTTPSGQPSLRFNGSRESSRSTTDSYHIDSRSSTYSERSKYNPPVKNSDYIPRIDLTRSTTNERQVDHKIRDDRNFIIEERKRPTGPIVSNIPEKVVRYETWTDDSRIDRISRSAREQQHLMSQPVYSYSAVQAYQNEQKRNAPSNVYREHYYHHHHHHHHHQSSHANHRYYPTEPVPRDSNEYHAHYLERNSTGNARHVIQKIPSREMHPDNLDTHNGIPADERVLSILRNSLETKHKPVETVKSSNQITDLIVIDDDTVIEINDDNETEIQLNKTDQHQISSSLSHHIQMPKAVDSLVRDSDYRKSDNSECKSKSPENDVASRIRTKAELKVMPPSEDTTTKCDIKQDLPSENETKLLPKSQKQHLFNQIREDNLRLESVIKNEKPCENFSLEVKTEAMNIDEIEKDAEIPIKTENITENCEYKPLHSIETNPPDDLDWANACDNFVEQLKSGFHKKKNRRKRNDTIDTETEDRVENLTKVPISNKLENAIQMGEDNHMDAREINKDIEIPANIVIKQEPFYDEDETKSMPDIISPPENFANIKEEIKIVENEDKTENFDVKKEVIDHVIIKKIETEPTEEKSSNELTNKSDRNIKSTKCDSHIEHSKIDGNIELKHKKRTKETEKYKNKMTTKVKAKSVRHETSSILKDAKPKEPLNVIIKEECESTDDDEPLIKSKILKEKENSERLKHRLLKDLSEKSAYVKLECCVTDMNKNTRKSFDATIKEEKQIRGKMTRQSSRSKCQKLMSVENSKNDNQKEDSTTDSDDEDISVASRLRIRKNVKSEETKPLNKSPAKLSPMKKGDNNNYNCISGNSRKPGFGDGSDFHPGWEEELYRYKRSLRMPSRLIAIPRGRSGGPFVRGSSSFFTRGSTSLPDLDPAPLSPAPSSAQSAATDDIICARRPDKLALDSDLDSNSSCSVINKLQYDSEASTSTTVSTSIIKKRGSIVDVLIQKCGKKEESKKRTKDKDDKIPKVITKSSNELLATPSLGLVKNGNKGSLCAKKEKLMEDIFYLGAFRKETVTAFRNAFIKNTGGLIGATEEFSPVVLKSRTRTESRVLKQRATMKEVFGDERPASAPPTSCIEDVCNIVEIKKEPECDELVIKQEPEPKPKIRVKKILKNNLSRRSSSIRDGLRSTKGLKRNDAKGRLLRLKKRNNNLKSLPIKKIKDVSGKVKKEKSPCPEDKDKLKEEGSSLVPSEGITKRRLKRLFGKRKLSSGFDYIRKKKKIIRREDTNNKVRRATAKPSPESVQDIQKEIKGWIINKSIGETHLHRAARLGYTDCVAYCLEKMEAEPSAKDNAGFTPLHVAASKGHVPIAKLLLQYGADVSAAAQGGIRPLHEACENCHMELIRLLLSYGADPLLVTYSDQTPEELAEGPAALLIRLHIADVQGRAIEPWRFPPPTQIINFEELGCDPLSSPPPATPPPAPDSTIEVQCTEAPLPPFYSLRPTVTGQPSDGLWCLLQDITNLLQIKSKDSLLKQIHCGSGSPKELLREIRTQEFLERAQCHQLLCAGEKVNVRASKVALVRVTDKLRQLLKIETVLVS